MIRIPTLRFYKPLLICTLILCFIGFATLVSAALGQIGNINSFIKIIIIQLVGIVLGLFVIWCAVAHKKLDYRDFYRRHYALYFFLGSLVFQLMVFTPWGVSRNGALRWLDIGITTVQPSEIFKVALIVMLSALLVGFKKELKKIHYLVVILSASVGVFTAVMLLIRDKGSIIIAGISCFIVLIISHVNKLYVIGATIGAVVVLTAGLFVLGSESYAQERIRSYLGITEQPQGQDYQVNQSIATIGSGQVLGRGYGQSIQKHKFLPEPLSDSIFAIFAEEWGFVGSVVLIMLYVLFAWYALAIARSCREDFGKYVVVGLTTLIVSQSFFNMMTLVKLVPLSGMPLVFISKGGTSIAVSLLIVAIILNISRVNYARLRK